MRCYFKFKKAQKEQTLDEILEELHSGPNLDEVLKEIANDWGILFETLRKEWKGYPDAIHFLDEIIEEHCNKSWIQNHDKNLHTSNEQAIKGLEELTRYVVKKRRAK